MYPEGVLDEDIPVLIYRDLMCCLMFQFKAVSG